MTPAPKRRWFSLVLADALTWGAITAATGWLLELLGRDPGMGVAARFALGACLGASILALDRYWNPPNAATRDGARP
jgi:hypothetical protein